ncbi:3-beta hydroxysteroid dehydrogenase/isomerase family-domain-containing protein [Diaporthe sp. PMI_573]|nr:3-beta hydroxysteroid dehydrogenase/isomerase family-domain-containing protein [Diaporthaceae sp. PMI_573]
MASEKASRVDVGKVMVIGGCGFLGHHIVRLLLRDYACSVSVVDLRCTHNRRPDSDGVKYVEADITDAAKIASVFEEIRPDAVIHTASPAPHADGKVNDGLFKRVNIDGTQVIVDACKKTDVKALIYTSSASVASDNVNDLINADERWPIPRGKDQSEYYSETKAAAEEIAIKANRADGSKLLTTAIRPAGIVGEGDTMALHQIIKVYRTGKTAAQLGDNNNLFDFTYVENVAHAHLLALRALLVTHASKTQPLDHEKVDGEVFFITNDSPTYFWDFCRVIWNAAGCPLGKDHVWVIPKDVGIVIGWLSEAFFAIIRKPPTFTRQRCVYSCMTRYFCIDKAKRRLGYIPIVPLEEGLRRSVKWTLEQEALGNIKN